MKNEMNDAYKRIHWDNDKQGYFFWDEADMPVGWWSSKDEAALRFEEYCYELMKDSE
jgi:Leu/Phe-tRNA-protein transferase|tara:strand:+ start:1126 stop:1296 length:171 start_codon:yes stop_codon:yes gene_type:complete